MMSLTKLMFRSKIYFDKSKEPVKHPLIEEIFSGKKEQATLKSQTRQFPPKLKHYLFKSEQIFLYFSMFSLIENKLLILLPPILNWAYNRSSQKKIL